MLCLVAYLCLTLCNPEDCSLPGSCVHRASPGKNTGMGSHALLQGIFTTSDQTQVSHRTQVYPQVKQTGALPSSHQRSPRVLEWAAYSFSRGSSPPRDRGLLHCRWVFTSWATMEAHLYLQTYLYLSVTMSYWFYFFWRTLSDTVELKCSHFLWFSLSEEVWETVQVLLTQCTVARLLPGLWGFVSPAWK